MTGKIYIRLFAFVCLLLSAYSVSAQKTFFRDVNESVLNINSSKRVIKPRKYRTLELDSVELLKVFRNAPSEQSIINKTGKPQIITLPLPNGKSARFNIWEVPVMSPELAAKFPNIKTMSGQGIDDKTATIKLDWTEFGFHAMILSPTTTSVFIDSYEQNNKTNYISYFKSDLVRKEPYTEGEVLSLPNVPTLQGRTAQTQSLQCIATQLRTYRLAVACTAEYAIAATGLSSPTVAQALSAIVTTVNRVDGVYETEIDVRIVLVPTETNVIFTSLATEPFTANSNAQALLTQSQQVIDSLIGSANYDMGHTFSTGAGGLSYVGVTCYPGYKSQSVTGSSNPVGDGYNIDYVAHEMGHELGAYHPFNSQTGSCGYGNGNLFTDDEPGSGSTIMAYAGICGSDNLQPHSDPQFNALNLDQITTYITTSYGNNCPVITSTGNIAPVVNAGASYTIPISTPFALTGSATDANGDSLSYSWEEIDVGGPYTTWNAPTGNAPLFRPFPPVTTPVRYFPKLSALVSNTVSTDIGEVLPTYARTLNFRLTARDNKSGGGGVCSAVTTVPVSAAAGPFVVTYPSASGIVWTAGQSQTITWNVANTNSSPVNCSNVTIQLSTDSGYTYPYILLASTANNGSAIITVPNVATTTARIRVMAVGNIFYNISGNIFKILYTPPSFTLSKPDTVRICGIDSGATKLFSDTLYGFNKTISLTASGNPTGTSVSFSKTTLNPVDSVIVTLHGASSLATGIYNITVTGTSDTIVRKQIIPFSIIKAAAASSLTSPLNAAVNQSFTPVFNWSAVAGSSTYTLEISLTNTFTSLVQSITGISGNSYTLSVPLAGGIVYYWRVKSYNSCGAATVSAYFSFTTIIQTFNFSTPDTIRICGIDSGFTKLYADSVAGYNKTISLSASGNPVGTTVSFSKTIMNAQDSVMVTLHGASTLASGVYNMNIVGTSDTIIKTRTIPFTFVQAVAPAGLTNPANASIVGTLNPTFNWTAVAGASSYTLEISASNTFTTIVQSIPGIVSNSYTLGTPLSINTIYYWRIKAYNSCGTATISAIFSFKIAFSTFTLSTSDTVRICGIDSAFTILYTDTVYAYNKSINLSASGNPAGTTVSFSKTTLNPVDSVIVTLHGASTLATGHYNVTITGVSDTITRTSIIPFSITQAVSSTGLSSPVNGSVGNTVTPIFKWSVVSAAVSYSLEISTANSFASLTQSITGITNVNDTLATPLASNTLYYWRIKAFNACGAATVSAIDSFRTVSASFTFSSPDTVHLCNVDSGFTILYTDTVHSFSQPINLSASGNPPGTTVSFSKTTINPYDSVMVTLLNTSSLPTGVYNITVTGTSDTIVRTRIIPFSFTQYVNAPNLLSPGDTAVGLSLMPTFRWSAVSGASSYTLEVSVSNTFATIADSITGIADTSYVLTTPLMTNTIYYWRLIAYNSCGNATFTNYYSFETALLSCNTYVSTDTMAISSISPTTINSVITIPLDTTGAVITHVKIVRLVGIHSWISDLTFTLIGPTGITDTLINGICSTIQYKNFNINLDDQAPLKTFPCPPTNDTTVAPQSPLAVFNGQSASGTWTLRVHDNGNHHDGGDLYGWGLQICTIAASPIITWIGVTSSDWTDPSNWSSEVVPTVNSNVSIPAGTPFAPIIPTGITVSINSLSVMPGTSFTVETNAHLIILH